MCITEISINKCLSQARVSQATIIPVYITGTSITWGFSGRYLRGGSSKLVFQFILYLFLQLSTFFTLHLCHMRD